MPKEWAPSDQADVPDHLKIPSDLCTLPYDQLPVLVATRMSLSFPVLLSAVPLYTCRADDDPTWVRHWMSDGGIGSNFPIHFFDSLIPRWPTLALRFIPQRDGATVEPHPSIDDVECQPPPRRRSRARALDPRRHPEIRRSAITTPFGFLAAVLDTMQNWGDTLQSELPGYRDRIEDIVLAADEGGMNLAMGKDTIGRVRCKGKLAGLALKDEFDWEAHRLLRYMMSMRLLDESLGADRLQRAFHFGGFATDLVKDDLIESIAARLSDGDEESAALAEQLRLWYPATRRKHALECTEHLLTTIAAWSSDGVGDAQDASSGSRRSAASAAGDGTGANGSTPRYFRDEPEPYPSSVLRVSPPV
jgi:hypothetical protein